MIRIIVISCLCVSAFMILCIPPNKTKTLPRIEEVRPQQLNLHAAPVTVTVSGNGFVQESKIQLTDANDASAAVTIAPNSFSPESLVFSLDSSVLRRCTGKDVSFRIADNRVIKPAKTLLVSVVNPDSAVSNAKSMLLTSAPFRTIAQSPGKALTTKAGTGITMPLSIERYVTGQPFIMRVIAFERSRLPATPSDVRVEAAKMVPGIGGQAVFGAKDQKAGAVIEVAESVQAGTYSLYAYPEDIQCQSCGLIVGDITVQAQDAYPCYTCNPLAPAITKVVRTSRGFIRLLIKDNSRNESGFSIERTPRQGSDAWIAIDTVAANQNTGMVDFVDSTIQPDGQYRYRVIAWNGHGSAASTPHCAAPPQRLPENVRIIFVQDGWVIRWNNTNEETLDVRIERRTPPSVEWSAVYITGTNGNPIQECKDRNVSRAARNYYRVVFGTTSCGTATSEEVFADENNTVPAMPTELSISQLGPNQMITWRDNATNESRYIIERRIGDGSYDSIGQSISNNPSATGTRSFQIRWRPAEGVRYCYNIMAINAKGNSAVRKCKTGQPLEPPAAPSDLSVSRTAPNSLRLKWRDNSTNESSFRITVRTHGSPNTIYQIEDHEGTGWVEWDTSGLQPAAEYCFSVCACNMDGNSCTEEQCTSTDSLRPDLVVDGVWIEGSANPDNPFVLYYTIFNIGTAPSQSSQTKIFHFRNDNGAQIKSYSKSCEELQPGTFSIGWINYPDGLKQNCYHWIVIADEGNDVGEASEINNAGELDVCFW